MTRLSPGNAVPECGGCGAVQGEGVTLFFIPGGWGWVDDLLDGRMGLCLDCGTSNERYEARFREHFGDVRVVRDTETAASREASL